MLCINSHYDGQFYVFLADAAQLLQSAREDGYDYITTELPHTQEARSDVTALTGRWWRTSIVGVVPETSTPLALLDRLGSQLEWAIHMGIPAVILPSPPDDMILEYARVLQSLALEAQSSNIQLWLESCYWLWTKSKLLRLGSIPF